MKKSTLTLTAGILTGLSSIANAGDTYSLHQQRTFRDFYQNGNHQHKTIVDHLWEKQHTYIPPQQACATVKQGKIVPWVKTEYDMTVLVPEVSKNPCCPPEINFRQETRHKVEYDFKPGQGALGKLCKHLHELCQPHEERTIINIVPQCAPNNRPTLNPPQYDFPAPCERPSVCTPRACEPSNPYVFPEPTPAPRIIPSPEPNNSLGIPGPKLF